MVTLQFGHGGEAVESRGFSTVLHPSQSFNSATAVKPWKALYSVSSTRHGLMELQFGHGGEAVESGSGHRCDTSRTGFNSATAVKPWKVKIHCINCSHWEGFNSATAVKPWKDGTKRTRSATPSMLQFGHGGEAVESTYSSSQPAPAISLQFGHGGEAVERPDP